jgi:glycosyltransferase involved in cell wall biosynthesis
VDRTYVVSAGLLENREAPGRQIEVLASGIDLRLVDRVAAEGFDVPPRLRGTSGPIIGYVGGLTNRMDWDLLHELAARRPDWKFVLVGGDPRVAPSELGEHSNVIFQASVPYPQALAAVSRFDVGTIPVRPTAFSRGNSFMKLLDYFAHGIPVVATPLPDSCQVEAEHPGLLLLASDPDAWEAALSAALAEPADSPLRAARRAYVQQRSVERRIAHILDGSLDGRI